MREALEEIAYLAIRPEEAMSIEYYQRILAQIEIRAKNALKEQTCQTNS